MIVDTERIKRETFRYLVYALVFSLLYDFFWFFMLKAEQQKDSTKIDGGLEEGIKRFSMAMASISFAFRVSPSMKLGTHCSSLLSLCSGKIRLTSRE